MTSPELEKLIDQYRQEFTVDVDINMMNLRDKLMVASSTQHKWVGRLIRLKQQRQVYENRYNHDLRVSVEKLKKGTPHINVSETMLRKQVEGSAQLVELNTVIQNYDLAIEYIERMDKVFTQGGHAMRNLVELMKLETT